MQWWLDKSWLDEREREVIKTFEDQPLGTETNLTNNKWKEMMTSRVMEKQNYNDDETNDDEHDDREEEADHVLSQLLRAPVREWKIVSLSQAQFLTQFLLHGLLHSNKSYLIRLYYAHLLWQTHQSVINGRVRVEICRDRHDRQSCKICASCVNFPGNQRDVSHHLRRTTRFTHTKCGFALTLLKF